LDNIIKVEAYSKYFGQNLALENIDLSIKKGEVVSIIGPSGSGKSTLLRSLIGLEQGNSGIIKINNMEIFDNQKEIKKTKLREIHREMAMVFQNFNLFPHLNVRDNITMGLKIVEVLKYHSHFSVNFSKLGFFNLFLIIKNLHIIDFDNTRVSLFQTD
jgi:ABC-type polar amino acid transport system ATPase subunit